MITKISARKFEIRSLGTDHDEIGKILFDEMQMECFKAKLLIPGILETQEWIRKQPTVAWYIRGSAITTAI
jgi:hypothetical protein